MPLLWANIFYKEREVAQKVLGKMPWASPVMKPAILMKKSWSRQHTRANAAKRLRGAPACINKKLQLHRNR